jgi:N-ethylmaleimide reductase
MNTKLWQPIQLGNIKLNHRLAMAPMTRGRSAVHGVPTDLNAEYYAQQASMALIISEGTPGAPFLRSKGGAFVLHCGIVRG